MKNPRGSRKTRGLISSTPGREVSTISKQGLEWAHELVRRDDSVVMRKEDYNPWFLIMPRCSVIVVTYNSGAQIEACLRALASQDCEIVVVDNASQDDTVARVRALARQIPLQLLTISRNIGFAGGVNQGVRAAASDVLLILNPDAIAEPGAIDAMLDLPRNVAVRAPQGARCWRATASLQRASPSADFRH